ncbi:MAG: DUF4912 domain-containing protein [Nitrospirae bacterium]|nr:DUF4912 domain-containing protein [Nitrospirota bacterium]
MENTLIITKQEAGQKTGKLREDVHGIAFLLSDTLKYPIVGDYKIPAKYDTDTIVILPVTEKKVYVYWELTERLLIDKTQNPSASSFTVKIYEITLGGGKNYNEKEIYSTAVIEPLGQIYAECTDNFKPMTAAIGVERDGMFNVLLKSNQINIPSFSVLGMKEEFWSKDYTDVKNVDEFMGITKNAELPHSPPGILEKGTEIITRFLDIRSKDMENIETLLGLIEKKEHLSDDERTMLELIKGLFESRAKDVQLLNLFFEFLRFLGLNNTRDSILEYLYKLKGITGSSGMSGSSEIHAGKRS